MGIFKAYDIRGVVPDELGPAEAYRIGRGCARFLGEGPVAVGRDARPHSPDLAGELIRGIRDEGLGVVDLGLVSTPMLYYAVDHLGAGGGVMVTASHNPARYNGFKICREHAIPVGGETGLGTIEALAAERGKAQPVEPRGELRSASVAEGYAEHVLRLVGGSLPPLRAICDCGNGMASVGLRPLLARTPLRAECLYEEPDGTFPNHEADPLKPENLRDLVEAVRRHGADFGVAFDGDADRAVFVDDRAEPIPSDRITALLARRILRDHPGGRVLYDLRSSRVTREEVGAAGGVPEMCRVGHSFVKARMRETGAVFGGELSGHYYFRFSETLCADDGVAAFAALAALLGEEGRPLSELVAPLRRYAASGEINRKVDDVEAVLARVEAHYADARISHLDGLLVEYPEWWFNLRPSNTEPVLRLNLEAPTVEEMERRRDEVLALVGGSPA